jgi:hypothetical protein
LVQLNPLPYVTTRQLPPSLWNNTSPGGFVSGGAFMEIRAKAQSPEHLTLRTVNGSVKTLYWLRCAADFKTSAVADEHGETDSLVTRGATDWPVGAASREPPASQAVTDATAAVQTAAYLIMSIA